MLLLPVESNPGSHRVRQELGPDPCPPGPNGLLVYLSPRQKMEELGHKRSVVHLRAESLGSWACLPLIERGQAELAVGLALSRGIWRLRPHPSSEINHRPSETHVER